MNRHETFGRRQWLKSETSIKLVRVPRRQQNPPQSLKRRMGQNCLHHPFPQSLAAMLLQYIHVSKIRKRRRIRNRACETDLVALLAKQSEAKGPGNRFFHNRSGNSRRPIGTRQISMNRGYIESRLVSRDGVAISLRFKNWMIYRCAQKLSLIPD